MYIIKYFIGIYYTFITYLGFVIFYYISIYRYIVITYNNKLIIRVIIIQTKDILKV